MATTHYVEGAKVKVRHPLAPLALSILTLGMYTLYWYFTINREMRDTGEPVSPWVALLAVTFGAFLVVPPFVSMYNTAERIRRTQERAGVHSTISAVLALVMLFIPVVSAFVSAYLQSSLNSAWERRSGRTTALTQQRANEVGMGDQAHGASPQIAATDTER